MRPGFRMPTGSKACFNRRCSAIMPGGKGWKTSSSPTAPRYSVACPPAAARGGAHRGGRERGAQPAQGAAPLDVLCAGQRERRRGRRHRQPPQRTGCAKERQLLVTQRVPVRCGIVHGDTAQRSGGRAYRAVGTAQAQAQPLAVVTRGRQRQRAAGDAVHRRDRLRGIARTRDGDLARRQRQHLERDIEQHAQRAERAAHQSRHVVAGDVLHHLAAESEQLAASVDAAHAEHEVARRTGIGTPRAGHRAGDSAAERRRRRAPRRLEAEHLPAGGQQRLDLGERRAGARGQHQFGGFPRDDAAVRGDVQASRRAPGDPWKTRVPPPRMASACRPAHACRDARGNLRAAVAIRGHAQNRSSSGWASAPRCTCMRPNSAQRASVGTALPGFSRPAGSKAALHARGTARARPCRNCTHIWSIFSTPTPCSPVMVPPHSTQSSRMRAPNASARCSSPGCAAS